MAGRRCGHLAVLSRSTVVVTKAGLLSPACWAPVGTHGGNLGPPLKLTARWPKPATTGMPSTTLVTSSAELVTTTVPSCGQTPGSAGASGDNYRASAHAPLPSRWPTPPIETRLALLLRRLSFVDVFAELSDERIEAVAELAEVAVGRGA